MLNTNRISHFLHARPRLIFSNLLCAVCFFLLPEHYSILTRGIICWNVFAWVYLICLWWLIARTNSVRFHHIAKLQDESAATVLVLVTLASIASLMAILVELASTKGLVGVVRTEHLMLTFSTLTAAWLLIPTAFAIHYAHIFYLRRTDDAPILFPDKITEPLYWDFLYFSFTIAVASQTADVAVGNTKVRKLVLFQSVLAFIFNISILGLSINVGASLLG